MNVLGRVGIGGALNMFMQPSPTRLDRLIAQRVAEFGVPRRGLSEYVNDWRSANQYRLRSTLAHFCQAYRCGIPLLLGCLYCDLKRANGEEIFLGLASLRVVTTAGVNYIVSAWQNTVELENMKFHALGTGGTAEAIGDTALVTEWTSSEYAARATGSLTVGASNNVFRTVGTNTKLNSGTSAVTEHGIFSSATIGAATLLDRSLFSAVNMGQNDAFSTQYDLTCSAGG